MALGGCATHLPPPRMISTEWVTVQALPHGTMVAVYLGEHDVRYGAVEAVTDLALTIREEFSIEALSRGNVQRVATRVRTGTTRTPHIVTGAVVGGLVAASLAWMLPAMRENPHPPNGWTWTAGWSAAGAAVGAMIAPQETYHERLIYSRPAK